MSFSDASVNSFYFSCSVLRLLNELSTHYYKKQELLKIYPPTSSLNYTEHSCLISLLTSIASMVPKTLLNYILLAFSAYSAGNNHSNHPQSTITHPFQSAVILEMTCVLFSVEYSLEKPPYSLAICLKCIGSPT